MTDDNVFPQDGATGAGDETDWDDAAQFAHHADELNNRDYVVGGIDMTGDAQGPYQNGGVNWSTNTLNVGDGKIKLYQTEAQTNDHTGDGGPPSKVLKETVFTVQVDTSGDLALTDNATNHVFIGLDQQTNDRYLWQVNTDNTPPSEPYLKVGEVDTANNVVTELNRAPAATFRELTVK